MDQREILARVDHTILTPTATWEQVKAVCDEGKQLGVASVCIPPRYVKRANDYAGGGLKICTVVGFPNGYATPEVKVFETEDAIRDGADEIDMVINQGLAKEPSPRPRPPAPPVFYTNTSKPAILPARKKPPCAGSYPCPGPSSSRPPPALGRAGPRWRT